jgi:hypothetical protein
MRFGSRKDWWVHVPFLIRTRAPSLNAVPAK